MDIKPVQQVEIMVDKATGIKFRACTTCKRFNIPLLDTRRTCSGCRQKRNESSKKAREQSRAKIMEAELATGNSGQRSSPSRSNSTPTHVIPPPAKRKAEKTTPSLEGEDRPKKVAKTMKLSLEVTTQKESVSRYLSLTFDKETDLFATQTNKQPVQYPEYQSASSLYEAAKNASSTGGRFNFLGCHSIVRCDDINHRKRAKSVMRDLRKIVKLSFK